MQANVGKGRSPKIKASHMRSGLLGLGARGLQFDLVVDEDSRREFAWVLGTEDLLDRLGPAPGARCVVNPTSPSAAELKKLAYGFEKASLTKDAASATWGLPDEYALSWACSEQSGRVEEGQLLVLVCRDGSEVVGHAVADVSLGRDVGDKHYSLWIELKLVYVRPASRGRGFGLDLSIAMGILLEDLVTAAYRAIPSGSSLGATVYADWNSGGGELFTRHVVSLLESTFDLLEGRPSITVEGVELDAGY